MFKKVFFVFSLFFLVFSFVSAQTLGGSEKCPTDQILTQNLRAPAQNGQYSSFTGEVVTEVKILQTHMNRLGFNAGIVDGILGPQTETSIKSMQTFLGTIPDGMVGPATRELINNSCSGDSDSGTGMVTEEYDDSALWKQVRNNRSLISKLNETLGGVDERIDWDDLLDVPAGFADDVDDDTTYSAGGGLSLAGTVFSLDNDFGAAIDSSEITDSTIVAADLGTINISEFTNDSGYLTAITSESIEDLSDVYSSMSPTDGQVLTFDTTNGWQSEDAAGGGGNTLDQAYDQGGAGVGRTITADSGAFNVGGVDGVLFTGTYGSGTLPTTGAGTRMMWYPKKAAFRAGNAIGTEWDDSNIGDYSVAMGRRPKASGTNSISMGYDTLTSGTSSVALGHSTEASGNYSVALGSGTEASGSYSFAMGSGTTSSGWTSIAMGFLTTASANYSIAMGQEIQASGLNSFAVSLNDQNGANLTQANTMAIMGGQVGIDTLTPVSALDVNGDIKIGNDSATCDATTHGSMRYDSATGDFEGCTNDADDNDTTGDYGWVKLN